MYDNEYTKAEKEQQNFDGLKFKNNGMKIREKLFIIN